MTAITTVGFPIVAWLVTALYVRDMNEKHRLDISELSNSNREEMNKVLLALNNNTNALIELRASLQKGEGE